MVDTFHIAAQYLTTIAISFLDKKDDDSHTNLGWKDGALQTHVLSEHNCIFSLDYASFSLVWTNDLGYRESLALDGKKHSEIIHWIRKTSLKAKQNKVYEYKLHFELPYKPISSDFVFQKPSDKETLQLIQKRNLVQQALEKVLDKNIAIRIWPHHFDTGAFYMANEDVGIGLGMAIPDSLIPDFYLYVSGYVGHDAIELPSDTKLNKGRYYSEGWKGFALSVSELTENDAINFFTNAIDQYIQV